MPFPHISACPPRRAGIFPNLYSARPTSTLPQGERCGLSRAVSRLRGLDGLPGRLPQHCFLCEPQVSSFPSHLLSCFSLLMVSRVGALSPGVPQAVLSVCAECAGGLGLTPCQTLTLPVGDTMLGSGGL